MRDAAKQAFDFFTGRGYSPQAASGIAGNFAAESRFNTSARNPGDGRDGSDSIGIAQWNSDRAVGLSRFARANRYDPRSLETQLAYTDWELNNTHKGALEGLKAAKTPTEAAAAFVTGFERPKGSDRGAQYSHGWQDRDGHANAIFKAFGSNTSAQPMGQPAPQQVASAAPAGGFEILDDDAADAPAPGAQEVGFYIPGTDPKTAQPAAPAGGFEILDDEPVPSLGGGSPAGPAQAQGRVRVSLPNADPEIAARDERKAQYEAEARARRGADGDVVAGVKTALSGVARAVPFAPEIGAAVDYYAKGQGQSYEDALDRRRADANVDDTDRPVASYGGQIAAGLALPGGALASSGIKGAAAVGAGYGAAYGAGQGDTLGERAGNAAGGAALGGTIGAAVPAVLGAAGAGIRRLSGTPQAGRVAGSEVSAAADRLGVEVPRAVTTDNMSVQRAAAAARNIPFAGNPLVRGAERAITGLGEAADEVAAGYGGSNAAGGGTAAGGAITDWIKGTSADRVGKLYDAVDGLVDNSIRTPLSATQGAVADIAAKNTAAGLGPGKAAELVLEAVQRPEGLTYEGVKTLRTRVGELMKTGLLPADISGGELKSIYGALSKDLRSVVEAAGGPNAVSAFERANGYNALVQERRKQLAKIVGANGDVPAERVFDRLRAAASSSSRADVDLLTKARRAIGGEDWNDLAGSVVAQLGRDVEGQFSPQRFLTDYGKLSDAGKAVLFRSTGQGNLASSLDDIATVSSRFKDLQKFANPSGTAQGVAGGGIGAGLLADPVTTIGLVVGGNVLSRVLASPASASSAAKWAQAYERVVKKPAAASLAAYQVASRNLSSTLNSDLGLSSRAQDFMRALQGPVAGRADQEQQQPPGVVNAQPQGR